MGAIASGAILGGVGSELTGGNFWQGAAIGGFVAGFNHVMHNIDFNPPKEVLTQHWDARYSTDDKQWTLNKVSEGYQTINDSGAADGYQVVNIYGSGGKVVGSIHGNDALYRFNVATKGNYTNIYNMKIQAMSTVTLGQTIKYSGTAVNLVSKQLILPTRGGSMPGVILGEGLWWTGFGIESWGNYQLGNYDKIWQGILMKGATKGGPKAWKEVKKQLK
ncbi:hypothetical protein [Chryseobacterium gossypii]|uniref:hypothetical protein n=1 Tax=Chryseobacterium gossypii TaxID=3231602 RepID=UPI003525AADF